MKAVVIALLSLFVMGCVTETTGGFNVEASEDRALQDYLQLSRGYLAQGDLLNTRRHLNNAINIDDDNSDVHGVWGLLYAREGDVDLADASFKRALRIDSSNSQVRNNYAAFLYSNTRYEDAYEQLERVVTDTEYQARPQAFENMGLAALQMNELDYAEVAFSRALQLNPNQLRSSLELVNINLMRNNIIQARAYYRNFLTLIQFYSIGQSPRSLWLGIQLENALGNTDNVYSYGDALRENFSDSVEYQRYQQLLDDIENNE
ncbi:type IV pilus biogenesis/stability protein PilW [Gammaproteobacteria bacterium]|nr:type IV pilus biogenesis/stability protein PilW [Gammaproteobacteria bacterium]